MIEPLADAEGYGGESPSCTGTQRDPVVRPDVGALMAQAGRGAGTTAARKAGEGILGWLRGRKK